MTRLPAISAEVVVNTASTLLRVEKTKITTRTINLHGTRAGKREGSLGTVGRWGTLLLLLLLLLVLRTNGTTTVGYY